MHEAPSSTSSCARRSSTACGSRTLETEAEDQPVIPTDTGSARLTGQDRVSNSNNYTRGHGIQILKPVRTSLSFVSSSEFLQGLSGPCQIVSGKQNTTAVVWLKSI